MRGYVRVLACGVRSATRLNTNNRNTHEHTHIHTHTQVALDDLGYFFVIFTPLFLAYVFAGHLLFGSRLKKFDSIGDTVVTCLNLVLLGEHQWDDMWTGNKSTIDNLAALLYFTSFLVIMFLIMLNVLLAIVMDSYAKVKEAMNELEESGKNAEPISVSISFDLVLLCFALLACTLP